MGDINRSCDPFLLCCLRLDTFDFHHFFFFHQLLCQLHHHQLSNQYLLELEKIRMKGQWIKYSALALVVPSALAKDIDITSDAKLQALANEISDSGVLKGYKKITIGGDDVTTLSPLKNLKHVKKGSLFIEDASKLEDLSGLENLAEVDDKFAIDNNKKLTEVNLPSLENVGMSFVVEDNANVKSISLESLSNVGMSFELDGDALTSLEGLTIGNVGMDFDLEAGKDLTSLDGLEIGNVGMKLSAEGDSLPDTVPANLMGVAGMGVYVNGRRTVTESFSSTKAPAPPAPASATDQADNGTDTAAAATDKDDLRSQISDLQSQIEDLKAQLN